MREPLDVRLFNAATRIYNRAKTEQDVLAIVELGNGIENTRLAMLAFNLAQKVRDKLERPLATPTLPHR